MVGRQDHGHFDLSDERVDEIRQMRPTAVVESKGAVVVLEAEEDGPSILHWTAETPEALTLAVSTMQQRVPRTNGASWKITLINEAAFASELLTLGFLVHGHYLDHWLDDLASYQPARGRAASVREARDTECEELARLSSACASDIGWLASPAEWYRDWMVAPNSIIMVSEWDGSICGLCSVRQYGDNNDKVWIRELAVHPERRQSGVGRALLEAGLLWGQARGSARAFLAVDSRNVGARRLYESEGFRPNGEEEFNLIVRR